jgi:hypothetical protein
MRIVRLLGFILIAAVVMCSYGLVDFSVPITVPFNAPRFVFDNRLFSTVLYSVLITCLFGFYGVYIWRTLKSKLSFRELVITIFIVSIILVFSYPAFSNDIYNYIATAKVTFLYQENPYAVMPIELSHEPMLSFMHAANKVALYGPSWILLTFIPYLAGMDNLLLTIFSFKLYVTLFYFGTLWLVYLLSGKKKLSLVLFALNPLVLIESLVSGHNDVVMMFFALLGFYFLKKKRFPLLTFLAIITSIGIKYATVVLLPVYVYVWLKQHSNKPISWERVWFISALLMFSAFAVSPLREEMYPWYLQWVLVFVAMIPSYTFLVYVAIALSVGLSFRFAPYLYTRNWNGWMPQVKTIITFIPVILSFIFYLVGKRQVK